MVHTNRKIKLFLLLFVAFVVVIRLASFSYHNGVLKRWESKDFDKYSELSKWFIGKENNETVTTYQFPPLYPVLIIPFAITNSIAYITILNYVLMFLMIIPLYLLIKQFFKPTPSLYISCLVTIFLLPLKHISLMPVMLATFLFTCFILSFKNIHKTYSNFWLSSIFFSLLIMTKYIFFYLLPFIFLWFYVSKEVDKRFSKFVIWLIPSLTCFSIWSIRNMLIHGMNIKGMMGGYKSIFRVEQPLALDYNFERFSSFFSSDLIELSLMYIVSLVSIVLIVIYIKKKPGVFGRYFTLKDRKFLILLLFNFVVWFLFPCMTWKANFIPLRYISYMFPVYVIFHFVLLCIFLHDIVGLHGVFKKIDGG